MSLISSTHDFRFPAHAGGWSLVGVKPTNSTPWGLNSNSFVVEKVLGSPAFFDIDVEPDDKNTTRNVLVVRGSREAGRLKKK